MTALAGVEYPTPALVECPFGFYRALRDEAPLHRLPNGDYLVSRWEDIVHVARHPELFSNFIGPLNPGFAEAFALDESAPAAGGLTPWPLPFSDPPEHKLKRALCMPLVARDRLRGYEPMIRELADELIDRFVGRGEVEFKAEFADEFPPGVMLRIFGVPREDEQMIRAWMATSQGQGFRHATEEQKQRQKEALTKAREYFREAILARYERPTDDFLSVLVHAKAERDGELDLYYLVPEVTTLYSAAYHNTVYMLANTMLLLLQNPDQLEVVQRDRALLRPAIDEALRLESPVQWLQRVVVEDTELHGVRMPKGSVLLVLWGSGNRDERKFEDPDRFWVERPAVAKEQLAFGQGTHMCLGAPLARLEGHIAFEQLLDRLPNLRLSAKNDFAHISTVNHRGPQAVHVQFDPA